MLHNAQAFSDKVFAAFGDKRTARLFADLDALTDVMDKLVLADKEAEK